MTAGLILVDETALPLDDDIRAALMPTLLGSGGRIYSIARVS